MSDKQHRYDLDEALSLDRFPTFFLLGALTLLCCAIYFSHLHINGELLSFGPYELHWGAATGPGYLLNGEIFHFEGLPNLRNTAFFAGDDALLDLGYTIPTGRLLIPYLAGLLNLFTFDVYTSIKVLNLIFWIGGCWAAYGIGAHVLHSRWMGLIMAILLATSMGFVSNPVDVKVHLSSYAWFVIAVYLIHRLGFFDKKTPLTNVLVASAVIAFGMYVNGTHLMLLGYVCLLGIFRVPWLRLALPFLTIIAFTIVTKAIYTLAVWNNIHVGTMEQIIIGNFGAHLSQAVGWLFGSPVDFEISSPSGYYHYTDILSPFDDAVKNFPSFLLMAGVPLTVLAFLGFVSPRSKELQMGLALAFSGWVIVTLICTYWPWRNFFGYMYYYSVAGWYILGAVGTVNLATWTGHAANLCGATEAARKRVMATTLGLVFLVVLLYANQDILFGHLIEHLHFHRTIFVPYPWDWDFNVTDW